MQNTTGLEKDGMPLHGMLMPDHDHFELLCVQYQCYLCTSACRSCLQHLRPNVDLYRGLPTSNVHSLLPHSCTCAQPYCSFMTKSCQCGCRMHREHTKAVRSGLHNRGVESPGCLHACAELMDSRQILVSAAAVGASMALGLYLMHGVPRPASRALGQIRSRSSTSSQAAQAGVRARSCMFWILAPAAEASTDQDHIRVLRVLLRSTRRPSSRRSKSVPQGDPFQANRAGVLDDCMLFVTHIIHLYCHNGLTADLS